MSRRKRHVDDHTNHEAWAIPYGDLITLLLAFFVVMYAMSSVNEGKYRVLADALNAEFRGAPRSPKPIQIGERAQGAAGEEGALDKRSTLEGAAGELAPPVQTGELEKVINAKAEGEQKLPPTTPTEDLAGTAEELDAVANDVERSMDNLIRENLVAVRRRGKWIEVEIQTDILFPSGVATLSPLAVSVLAPLADAVKPFSNPIRVEGHTDNVPITTKSFPSNWELSSARAASVVHLFSQRGVAPTRLTVIGLGEYRPIKDNGTIEGRAANRRVVLVILGKNGLPTGMPGQQRQDAPTLSTEAQSLSLASP